MFGIGKILQQVLDQHNLGELSGRIDTDSVEGMRESIEALGTSGAIADTGGVLKDMATQLSGVLHNVGEHLTQIAEEVEVEVGDDSIEGLGATGAVTGAAIAADAEPIEAELMPHEAVHMLQGVAVEDDGVIATEAEATAPAATADNVQPEEAGETSDD